MNRYTVKWSGPIADSTEGDKLRRAPGLPSAIYAFDRVAALRALARALSRINDGDDESGGFPAVIEIALDNRPPARVE